MLKISDFGLCAVYKVRETGRTRMLSERCGSMPYLAPEVRISRVSTAASTGSPVFGHPVLIQFIQLLRDAPYEAEPVDVWGSGVILYTMLAGS